MLSFSRKSNDIKAQEEVILLKLKHGTKIKCIYIIIWVLTSAYLFSLFHYLNALLPTRGLIFFTFCVKHIALTVSNHVSCS